MHWGGTKCNINDDYRKTRLFKINNMKKITLTQEELEKEIKRAFVHGQGNAEMMEAGLERDETEDYVNSRMRSLLNHTMLEEINLLEVQANNTTQGLLDLITDLNDRVSKLTDTVKDLAKIVETNHKGLKLLTKGL